MQPKIIDLRDLDMGRAYDFTQGDQVQHGDVLLVSDGVAIMDRAWPVMVAGRSDVFHTLVEGVIWADYVATLPADKAARLAAGLELADAALVGGAA